MREHFQVSIFLLLVETDDARIADRNLYTVHFNQVISFLSRDSSHKPLEYQPPGCNIEIVWASSSVVNRQPTEINSVDLTPEVNLGSSRLSMKHYNAHANCSQKNNTCHVVHLQVLHCAPCEALTYCSSCNCITPCRDSAESQTQYLKISAD